MRLGGHVSTNGGLDRAVKRGVDIGADCLQIFVSSPQLWRMHQHKDEVVATFAEQRRTAGLDPVLIHSIYLINLASENDELRQKSIDSLVAHLKWAARLAAMGVVTHVGSSGAGDRAEAMDRATLSLGEVLTRSEGCAPLLLETTAGSGNTIGGRFEDLGELIARLGRPASLQVCLDTAHIFAAGYPCTNAVDLELTLDQLDRHVGIDRLTALHLNDSKAPFGSHRDRHENLGEGQMGLEAFACIANHPILSSLPGFLEVPGFDGEGPDAENLRRFRELIHA